MSKIHFYWSDKFKEDLTKFLQQNTSNMAKYTIKGKTTDKHVHKLKGQVPTKVKAIKPASK